MGNFVFFFSFSVLRQYQVFTNKNSESCQSFVPALLSHSVLLSLSLNSGFSLLLQPRHRTNLMLTVSCRMDVVKWEREYFKKKKNKKKLLNMKLK